MKTFSLIMKILAAIAAVAGVVYLVATYGDRIVNWFKKLLNKAKPIYSNKRNFDTEMSEEIVDADDSVEEEFED